MSLEVRRIDHVVLRVADLERSLRFYCEVLPLRVERRIDAVGLVQLRAGDSLLDLVPVDSPLGRMGGAAPGAGGRNVDHVAFRLQPFDEPALRRRLAEAGVEVIESGDRYGAEGTGPSLYLRDPDANVVELKGPATTSALRPAPEESALGAEALRIDRDPPPGLVAELEDRLYEWNVERTGVTGELLAIAIRDADGSLAAGLFGWTFGGACMVDKLWLRADLRGRGLGSRMMAAAEAEARRRGCGQVILSTHSFQAPEFYRKLGFEPVARIDDYPAGHAQIFFRKRLERG